MAIQLQLADVNKMKILEYTLTGTTDQLAWFIESKPDDVNLKDSKIGNCAMHIASFRGNINKVELLIRKHGDMNQKDIFGNAAIHYAIGQGNKDVVHLLLKNSADVNIVNHRGMTPLHAAALCNHVAIVRLLVKYSAIPNTFDLDHKRPKDLTGNAIIVESLEKATEYHRQGLKAPPNENLNWMGFGIGLGIGMGLQVVKQRMDFLEQCRLDEIKRKEEEAVARRLAEAEAKAARGKLFKRRMLEHKGFI